MQTTNHEASNNRESVERRGFLKGASALVLGGVALLTAPLAGLRVWLQPLFRSDPGRGEKWIRITRLSSLPDDEVPRRFSVIADRVNAWSRTPRQTVGAVFLRRQGGDAALQAFNVICPHAGCLVDYVPGDRNFLCPCHDSRFSLGGEVESPSSPSPRGLDALEVEVRNGDEVWVRFQNFRSGIKGRQPVG